MIDVRPMTPADLHAVAALSSQLGYPVSTEALAARFQRLRPLAGDALYVAGEPVAGWIHVQERHGLESDACAEIVALVVDAARRRSGAGRALVEAAGRWAGARGLARLVVRSNVARDEAHRFYPSLGFRLAKTQHVYERPSSP